MLTVQHQDGLPIGIHPFGQLMQVKDQDPTQEEVYPAHVQHCRVTHNMTTLH